MSPLAEAQGGTTCKLDVFMVLPNSLSSSYVGRQGFQFIIWPRTISMPSQSILSQRRFTARSGSRFNCCVRATSISEGLPRTPYRKCQKLSVLPTHQLFVPGLFPASPTRKFVPTGRSFVLITLKAGRVSSCLKSSATAFGSTGSAPSPHNPPNRFDCLVRH